MATGKTRCIAIRIIVLAAIVSVFTLSHVHGEGRWRPTRRSKQVSSVPLQQSLQASSNSQLFVRPVVQKTDPVVELARKAIEVNLTRRLDVNVHSPWQIMHAVLAYGRQLKLKQGDKEISALDWIASGPSYDGEPLILVTKYGARFHRYSRPYAFEGHRNQFLALLTSCHLKPDFKFNAQGKQVTLQDMINDAKWTTTDQDELTFTLWALIPYVDPNEVWISESGERWNFARIVQEQMQESLPWTPCGGTHLLYVLTLARDKYLAKYGRLDGVWQQLDQYVKFYVNRAHQLQNSDGSFSTEYFEKAGYTDDPIERLETSGHMLAFVAAAASEEQLRSDWVRAAVSAVSRDLLATSHQGVPCGPLYHAVHGVQVYYQRVQALEKSSRNRKEHQQQGEGPVLSSPRLHTNAPHSSSAAATVVQPAPVHAHRAPRLGWFLHGWHRRR